jgi:alcohol dehydrogenase class IV
MNSVFQFSCHSPMVWFGVGRALDIADRLKELGLSHALVATTASGAARYAAVTTPLGGTVAATFSGAQPHCPIAVANEALSAYRAFGCDCVITIGGGSTIGLGKYISVETGAPHIAVPTTLSGSEMTPLFGVLVDGEKRSRRDPRALANTVIVDPTLAQSLPLHETATTGMNAMAHCVEALYVPKHSPITDLLAFDGIKALYEALLRLAGKPTDLDARTLAAYGATIGGLLVNMVGIGMHHRICHVLGGRFGAPHGETNCVVLPHVLAFNEQAIPEATRVMHSVMGKRPALALYELAGRLNAPRALKELGIEQRSLDPIVQEALRHIDHNPRPVAAQAVAAILAAAWEGNPPYP